MEFLREPTSYLDLEKGWGTVEGIGDESSRDRFVELMDPIGSGGEVKIVFKANWDVSLFEGVLVALRGYLSRRGGNETAEKIVFRIMAGLSGVANFDELALLKTKNEVDAVRGILEGLEKSHSVAFQSKLPSLKARWNRF